MINYKAIGNRIKTVRKQMSMTQNNLSELLNVSPEYISRLESGVAKINLEMMVKIAKILNTEPEYFLSGTTSTSSSYLSAELNEYLSICSPKKIEAIIQIVKTIAEI